MYFTKDGERKDYPEEEEDEPEDNIYSLPLIQGFSIVTENSGIVVVFLFFTYETNQLGAQFCLEFFLKSQPT